MLKILKIQKISKIRENTENIEITQSHFTFQGHFTFQSHFTFQAILPFKAILHFKFQISGNQGRRNAKQEETFVRPNTKDLTRKPLLKPKIPPKSEKYFCRARNYFLTEL